MEKKEIGSYKKISEELIGGVVLYAIPLGILNVILIKFLTNNFFSNLYSNAINLQSITDVQTFIFSTFTIPVTIYLSLIVLINSVTIGLIWKFSISSTFKKRVVQEIDISKVFKKIIVFSIILVIGLILISIPQITSNISLIVSVFYILTVFLPVLFQKKAISKHTIK